MFLETLRNKYYILNSEDKPALDFISPPCTNVKNRANAATWGYAAHQLLN